MSLLSKPAPGNIVDLGAGKVAVKNVHGVRNARGSIVFAGQPTAEDTITIDGVVFTFKASGAAGNEINIGASLGDTIDNAVTVLEASVVAAVAAATYSNVGDTDLLIVHDSADPEVGNAFAIAASVATPSGATLSGGIAADTIPADEYETIALITTAGVNTAFALPDGVEGQERTVYLLTKGGSSNAVMSGDLAGGSTYTFDAAGEFVKLKWLGGTWVTIAATATLA